MSYSRLGFCLVLGVALQSGLQAAEPPVALESATALELCATCPSPQLRYLVVPKKDGGIKIGEAPEVELVSLGPLPRESYRKAFAAKWEGDDKKIPRAIYITVTSKEVMLAGLYDVYLNLQPKSKPEAARLHIQFTKPVPKAAAIPKLIIERTCYFPLFPCGDELPGLKIRETSQRSALTGLQFSKVNNTLLGSKAVGGELKFAGAPVTVPAGGEQPISYSLGGDFGLGVASGSIIANAAELETPAMTIDFEVRSHYIRIYLLVAIVLGLGFSYLTKIKLQQKIELEQARVDALGLAKQVEAEETRHKDQVFRDAYATALSDLESAIRGTDPAAINTAKQLLDTQYRDALQKLATRRQAEQTAVDGLLDITQSQWILPSAVDRGVERAKACAPGIQELLRVDDLEQAKAQRLQCEGDLANHLRTAALVWQGDWRQTLDLLTGATQGISTTVATGLATAAQQVRTQLARFEAGTQLETPEQIRQGLRDIQAGRIAVAQFADWLCSAISVEIAAAKTEVPAKSKSELFDALEREAQSWSILLRAMVDEPDAAAAPAALHGLHKAWKIAIEGLATPNQETLKAIEERRYQDAVKSAVMQTRPRRKVIGPASQGEEGESVASTGPLLLPVWSLTPGPGGTFLGIRTAASGELMPGATRPTLVTSTKQLMKDKLWLTVGVGVALTLVGYGVFREAWVGTFADFSGAFFWAFGLDMTVDTVMKATKKQ